MAEWILSGGRYENMTNPYTHKLYALSDAEKKRLCEILEGVKPIIDGTLNWTFEKALHEYRERFARDDGDRALCTWVWNLIHERCFPHVGYQFWLSYHGITVMAIIANPDKFKDAQHRWVDALIEEFSEKKNEDQGQEKAGDPGQQEAAPNE